MSNSYYRVALHVVFSTKYRELLITPKAENILYPFMVEQLKKQDCIPIAINGIPDHVHLLYFQNPKIPITDTIKQIKGASSFWLNQQKQVQEKFAWQNGYGVFSVSDAHIDKITKYIRNQKEHHKSTTLEMEMSKLK